MKLIRRLAGGKKSWSQPNFWNLPPSFVNTGGFSGDKEWIENDFTGYVQQIYKDNGAAYACAQTRALVFSEAVFKFRRKADAQPGDKNDPADPKKPGEEDDKKPGGRNKPYSAPKLADPSKKPTDPGGQPKKPGDKDKDKKPDKGKRKGDLFVTDALDILNKPWPGGSLGNMLFEMDIDASVAGNSYWTYCDGKGRYGNKAKYSEDARIVRMRPDFVQIVVHTRSGNPWALDAKLAGYLYKPMLGQNTASVGPRKGRTEVLLMPDEVSHYAPIQDPEAHFRGMSWLTPVLRELGADKAAMTHKKKFFDNGATLSAVVSLSEEVGQEDFEYFLNKFKEEHDGVDNAYKTLVLGGGADVSTIGVDLKQLDFTQTQGHGETRIAAASGVPPVIVGLSEGLQAATYSNYGQARRRFADATLKPLWRIACSSLATLIDVPEGAELWFDERGISFLRDDKKEEAEISETDARAAKALIEAGYEPDTVTEYLETRDPTVLEHTGMVSVQLLPPGTANPMAPLPMGGAPGAPAPGQQPQKPGSNPGTQGRQTQAGPAAKPGGGAPSQSKPSAPAVKPKPSRGKYVR